MGLFDRLKRRLAKTRSAISDGLTGLSNHRTFQGRYDEMLARAERAGKPVSLLLTDIDHFKSVNDTYGHPVGDAVLKAVAKVMQEQARTVDVVARYGGEEFAVILPRADRRAAAITAERIRQRIEEITVDSDDGEPLHITVSIGVATHHGGPFKSPEQLVKAADLGVYAAKESGRNRICFESRAREVTG